ncbi:ATP-binding protein [Streptomyces aureocirculatus]|uniref:ATP-binding protein n=1 Tax=Streptomyces aureocirculatus TaxID=67275 RepID=UPI0004C854E1|nr:ATP-binding protein [Streptomyces aureocirculatus]
MNQELSHAPTPVRQFTTLLSSTRRGARLARCLTVAQLAAWQCHFNHAEHIVAELANNAALHGRTAGRNFRLTLTVTGATLRVEVTDTRGDVLPTARHADPDAESGRGLLLVEALATRWGTEAGPAPCKTVWAEIDG